MPRYCKRSDCQNPRNGKLRDIDFNKVGVTGLQKVCAHCVSRAHSLEWCGDEHCKNPRNGRLSRNDYSDKAKYRCNVCCAKHKPDNNKFIDLLAVANSSIENRYLTTSFKDFGSIAQ